MGVKCPWRSVQNVFGVEASMVMQWTVNPPSSGTPGSIPGYSTKAFVNSVNGSTCGHGDYKDKVRILDTKQVLKVV